MDEREYTGRLLTEMRERHGCHTVILYGSRARGDYTPESDWDVAGLRDGVGEALQDARLFEGAYLDAFVYPPSAVVAPLGEELLKLLGGQVLIERDGAGSRLLEAVRALHREGPRPLPPAEVQLIRSWSRKMVKRIQRGDVEAHYRLHWLLFDLLSSWYRLRGLYYRGPKESLAELAASRPGTRALFEAALAPGAPLPAIEALVDEVLQLELFALLGDPAALASPSVKGLPELPELGALEQASLANDPARVPPWLSRLRAEGGDAMLQRLTVLACRGRLVPELVLDTVEAWAKRASEAHFQACDTLLAGDSFLQRETVKLVVTWGGVRVEGPALELAACRLLFLNFTGAPGDLEQALHRARKALLAQLSGGA